MNYKHHILLAFVLGGAVLLAGCSEYSRTRSAQRRWDRVLEKARIDAALQSIEEGRLQYAIQVLEDLIESESAFSEQAEAILKDLRVATQRVAAARSTETIPEAPAILN